MGPMKLMIVDEFGSTGTLGISWFHALSRGRGRNHSGSRPDPDLCRPRFPLDRLLS